MTAFTQPGPPVVVTRPHATIQSLPSELLVAILDDATTLPESDTHAAARRWFGPRPGTRAETTIRSVLGLRMVCRSWRHVWSTGMPPLAQISASVLQIPILRGFGVQHPLRLTHDSPVNIGNLCASMRACDLASISITASAIGGILGGILGTQLVKHTPHLTSLSLVVDSSIPISAGCDRNCIDELPTLQLTRGLAFPPQLVELCLSTPGLDVTELVRELGIVARFPPTLKKLDILACRPLPCTNRMVVHLPPSVREFSGSLILAPGATVVLSVVVRILHLRFSGDIAAIQGALHGLECHAQSHEVQHTHCRLHFYQWYGLAWDMPVVTNTLVAVNGFPRTLHPTIVTTLVVELWHTSRYQNTAPSHVVYAPMPTVDTLSVTGPHSVAVGLLAACSNLRHMHADCPAFKHGIPDVTGSKQHYGGILFAHANLRSLITNSTSMGNAPFCDHKAQLPRLVHLVVNCLGDRITATGLVVHTVASTHAARAAASIFKAQWADCEVILRQKTTTGGGRLHTITNHKLAKLRVYIPHLKLTDANLPPWVSTVRSKPCAV
jgi:hypothetical protein